MFLLFAIFLWSSATAESPMESCEVSRMKCAYRQGCSSVLHSYMLECADIMIGRSARCSDMCVKSLIALTSTEEGEALVRCDCQDNEFCIQAKQRVEVCRPSVIRGSNSSVISCSVAQWICEADALCSTALLYYRRNCRSMIHGRKCTPRCKNSIAILNRQEKAAKLRTCECDGSEDFDCQHIKRNMNHLCFGIKVIRVNSVPESDDPTVQFERGGSSRTVANSLTNLIACVTLAVLLVWCPGLFGGRR